LSSGAFSEVFDGGSLNRLDAYDAAQRPIAKQVISITGWLTTIATVPEYIRPLRNLIVQGVSPLVRRWLAWRLSMLGYSAAAPYSFGDRQAEARRLT